MEKLRYPTKKVLISDYAYKDHEISWFTAFSPTIAKNHLWSFENVQGCIEILKTSKDIFDLVIFDECFFSYDKKTGKINPEHIESAVNECRKIQPGTKFMITGDGNHIPELSPTLGVREIKKEPAGSLELTFFLGMDHLFGASKKNHDQFIDEFIERIDPEKKLCEEQIGFIWEELHKRCDMKRPDMEGITLSDGGYTSISGFEFKERFIKVDTYTRLKKEYEFYCLDLEQFNQFRPNVNPTEFAIDDSESIAILAMDNLRLYEPGIEKVKKIFGVEFKDNGLMYNLFLMSIFHKESSVHKESFGPVAYQGVHGLSHIDEIITPYLNISGAGLRRFQETQVDIGKIIPIVYNYHSQNKVEGNSVIHGDWKEDNLVNGHLVDYAMVGTGFEVDELAYYLSDAKFDFSLEQFHKLIDNYAKFRSSHDVEFEYKTKEGYGKEMHRLADSALLSQLVLRHSVMNKRDMMDDSKYRQREYYQQMIAKVLKEGKFA